MCLATDGSLMSCQVPGPRLWRRGAKGASGCGDGGADTGSGQAVLPALHAGARHFPTHLAEKCSAFASNMSETVPGEKKKHQDFRCSLVVMATTSQLGIRIVLPGPEDICTSAQAMSHAEG